MNNSGFYSWYCFNYYYLHFSPTCSLWTGRLMHIKHRPVCIYAFGMLPVDRARTLPHSLKYNFIQESLSTASKNISGSGTYPGIWKRSAGCRDWKTTRDSNPSPYIGTTTSLASLQGFKKQARKRCLNGLFILNVSIHHINIKRIFGLKIV